MAIRIKVPESGKVYNQRSGDDYTTIQAAVNAASDGETIIVQEGSYNVWCPTTDPNNYTGRNHNLFIGKKHYHKGRGRCSYLQLSVNVPSYI